MTDEGTRFSSDAVSMTKIGRNNSTRITANSRTTPSR